jgi:hypothetical protein
MTHPNPKQKDEIALFCSFLTASFLSSSVSYWSKNSTDLNTVNMSTRFVMIDCVFVFIWKIYCYVFKNQVFNLYFFEFVWIIIPFSWHIIYFLLWSIFLLFQITFFHIDLLVLQFPFILLDQMTSQVIVLH